MKSLNTYRRFQPKTPVSNKITLKPQIRFWGFYFGCCTGSFGGQWMLNHAVGQA